MNKRIRELAEQATTTEYGVDNGFDRVTFDKEKFAHMIVQKCADIGALSGDGTYEVYNSIVKYFGMQEPEE